MITLLRQQVTRRLWSVPLRPALHPTAAVTPVRSMSIMLRRRRSEEYEKAKRAAQLAEKLKEARLVREKALAEAAAAAAVAEPSPVATPADASGQSEAVAAMSAAGSAVAQGETEGEEDDGEMQSNWLSETAVPEKQQEQALRRVKAKRKRSRRDTRRQLSKLARVDRLPYCPMFFPIGATVGEMDLTKLSEPVVLPLIASQLPSSQHVLRVALLGEANVGKSTLANHLLETRIMAMAEKPQTTRESILGVLTRETAQVLLWDTPGVVERGLSRKYRLPRSLLTSPKESLAEAQIGMVVVDMSRDLSNLATEILTSDKYAPPENTFQILVLNKCDLVSKGEQTALRAKVTELAQEHNRNFKEVFFVSAKSGNGVSQLRRYLIDECNKREEEPFLVNPQQKTLQSPLFHFHELIREQILQRYDGQIPYAYSQKTLTWTVMPDGRMSIGHTLQIGREGEKVIILGRHGEKIAEVLGDVQRALRACYGFQAKVHCHISTMEGRKKNKLAF